MQPAGADRLGATLNISAFNLGNALGAWLGGIVLSGGLGLAALMPLAALLPMVALAMACLPERIWYDIVFPRHGGICYGRADKLGPEHKRIGRQRDIATNTTTDIGLVIGLDGRAAGGLD